MKKITKIEAGMMHVGLSGSVCEKDVENAWRAGLSAAYPGGKWTSPHKVDGLLDTGDGVVLCEFKYDVDMKSAGGRAKVIAQTMAYLWAMRASDQTHEMPTCVLIADKNEAVVYPASAIEASAERSGFTRWGEVAASKIALEDALVAHITQDELLAPGQVFSLSSVTPEVMEMICGAIDAATTQSARRYVVTPDTLLKHFVAWHESVLHKSEAERLSAQQQAALFMQCLLTRDTVYVHPKHSGKLIVEGVDEPIKIQSGSHDAFWANYPERYTITERRALSQAKDRIVEEEERRRTGEFFTPPIWVEAAMSDLDNTFGEGWEQRFVVWDCSCGLANITRDREFPHLFLSTINQEDIDHIHLHRYNGAGLKGGAIAFQFDFLNDPVEKLPLELRAVLSGDAHADKPLLFIGNPPYGTAGSARKLLDAADGAKTGMSKTRMAEAMRVDGITGQPTQQLYTQFLYRMRKLSAACYVAIFSKSDHMRCKSYRSFQDTWLTSHALRSGFFFRADAFAGVKDTWGVSWNVWGPAQPGETGYTPDAWWMPIKRQVKKGGVLSIKDDGELCLYISDFDPARLMRHDKGGRRVPVPFRMTNAVNVAPRVATTQGDDTIGAEDVCHFTSADFSGSVGRSNVVFATSAPHHKSQPLHVSKVREFAPLMVLRDIIQPNWMNEKAEFLAPNTKHPDFAQWEADCLLYLPLCNKGAFSGLRDVMGEYPVFNHWAMMDNQRIAQLADHGGFMELYLDAKKHAGHVPLVLPMIEQVLREDVASELARDAWRRAREMMSEAILNGDRRRAMVENPKLHLHAWDAGWYQVSSHLSKTTHIQFYLWESVMKDWAGKLTKQAREIGYIV